jgi:dTDP-glucose 4,6-dehydratase
MQRTIVITGGAGFVGVNLVQHALKKGYNVVAVDTRDRLQRLHYVFQQHFDSRLTFLPLNLAEQPLTFAGDVDVVIHLAALPQVDYSFYYPKIVRKNNTSALENSLDFALERKIPLLFTSSVAVYGGNEEKIFRENDTFDSQSPYAASKVSCEEMLRSYRVSYGLTATTVRLTNLYGPWQAPDRILPRLITQMISGYPGEVEPGKSRDYLYVEEAVEALLCIVEQSLWNEVFNISTEEGYNNEQLISLLQRASGKQSLDIYLVDAKQRDGRGKALISSCEKLSRASGWRSNLQLLEGLRTTYDWYLAHQDWWQQFDANIKAGRGGPEFIIDCTCAL